MKSILSSLLYASVKSQSATTSAYQVTDCNNDATQRPELTFKIAQDFFSNNLSGHEGDYELRDGYYHRIIEESELTLGFGTNANGDGGEFTRPRIPNKDQIGKNDSLIAHNS